MGVDSVPPSEMMMETRMVLDLKADSYCHSCLTRTLQIFRCSGDSSQEIQSGNENTFRENYRVSSGYQKFRAVYQRNYTFYAWK